MISGYKIRIYPTPTQEELLWKHINSARFMWNYMLNLQETLYHNNQKHLDRFHMCKVISDMITNYPNKYIELFDPKRINLSNVLGTVNNAFKSIEGLVNGMINTNNNIEYKTINNKEIAIYKDNLGNHLVYTKCPHQGCKLLFNEIEKTWDCPCHASRFDIDGKCISGPANKDITVTAEDNVLPQEELVDNIELS